MRGENGERERALLTQRNQSPDLGKKTRSICTSPSCMHTTRPYTLASLERGEPCHQLHISPALQEHGQQHSTGHQQHEAL